MKSLLIASLFVVVMVSLGLSQAGATTEVSRMFIRVFPYSASGGRLEGCQLQSVKSKSTDQPVGNLNRPSDMEMPLVTKGTYRIGYVCGDRLHYDETVDIAQGQVAVVVVDRSDGHSFKFRNGYPQGMRVALGDTTEVRQTRSQVGWARLSHLLDGEGWIRELPYDDRGTVFPAAPGVFLLTFSASRQSVCTALIEITSYSSKAILADEGNCVVTPVIGLQVLNTIRFDPAGVPNGSLEP